MIAYGVVGTCLEVHVDLVFGKTASHELTVAAEDVATCRLDADAVALQTVSHLCPIVLLGSHNEHGLADNGKTNQRQDYCDGEVAGHYFITLELTHSVFLLGYIYNIWGLV